MGQIKKNRRLPSGFACARGLMLRTSPRKLNLVAALLRGRSAKSALSSLSFCSRRVAYDVRKILASAIANAENNHDLDIDKLKVVEATVGRSMLLKRLDIRGRSKSGRIMKPFSNMRIVLAEEKGIA